MTGRILGFDLSTNTGMLLGDDKKRYKFNKIEWKETIIPEKEVKVDFNIEDNGSAFEVYKIDDRTSGNNEIMTELLAVGITFFFAFIGTFITRLVLAKQPLATIVIPTLIHFIITVLLLIPLFGWIIYLIGTTYYMIENYQLVLNEIDS